MVTRPTSHASAPSEACTFSYCADQSRRVPSGLSVKRLGCSPPSTEVTISIDTCGFIRALPTGLWVILYHVCRGVSALDGLSHLLSRAGRIAIRLAQLGFRGQRVVLDRVAEPCRVVASLQMMQPRLVVDAGGELQERRQIERPQVKGAGGTAEVEALVFAEPAFGIFTRVPTMGLFGLDHRHELRLVLGAQVPRQHGVTS